MKDTAIQAMAVGTVTDRHFSLQTDLTGAGTRFLGISGGSGDRQKPQILRSRSGKAGELLQGRRGL